MLIHNPILVKHHHLRFAEYGKQPGVGADVAIVGSVLQVLGHRVILLL